MKRLFLLPALFILTLIATYTPGASSMKLNGPELLSLDFQETASVMEIAPHYESTKSYLSPVYDAEQPFQLLGLNWQEEIPAETAANMEIRFRELSGLWTDWQPIHENTDGPSLDENLHSYFITNDSDAFQYRAALSTTNTKITPKLANIEFDYVNGGESAPSRSLSKLIFKDADGIVSRRSWKANEELRYYSNGYSPDSNEEEDDEVEEDPSKWIDSVVEKENGRYLRWPMAYPKKVSKIFLHHTATTSDLDDPEEAVRAIYQYHANSRGWGDIGYNFIIAPDGTVFEGRAGGEAVVAGHAAGFNTGSVGIALLGNYEDSHIPKEMMQSLTALLYEQAELYDIDIDDDGIFRERTMDNLMGHQDVAATACPGDHAYDFLPDLRRIVGAAQDNNGLSSSGSYGYEETTERELVILDPQERQKVSVTLKNEGSKTWTSSSFLTVNANYSADKIVDIEKDSKKAVAYMKESSVKPGSKGTFTFEIESGVEGGLAHFDIVPVFNGSQKSKLAMDLAVYVEESNFEYKLTDRDVPRFLKNRESAKVTIELKNTGNLTWENTGSNAMTLKRSGTSRLTTASTVATLIEDEVKPGETGSFEFTIKGTGGSQSLKLIPNLGSLSSSSSFSISVDGSTSNDDAELYSDEDEIFLSPGETELIWLQLKNTSSEKWNTKEDLTFSFDGVEATGARVAARTLSSGSSTRVYLTVTAPQEEGDHTLEIRVKFKGSNLTSSPYELNINVGGSPELTSIDNPIRILLTPDNEVGTPILSSESSFGVYDGTELLKTFKAGSRVRVTDQGDSMLITSGSYKATADGPIRVAPGGADPMVKVLSMSQRPGWNLNLNDNHFRGIMEVTREDGKLILINELGLENYLRGIAEVSNNAPEHKIKTILIAARSYAVYYMTQDEKFPGKPYHLDDSPERSQKYLGYNLELRNSGVADLATETAGQVVTYNGEVVKVPYFNESDGRTKSANEVWGWTHTPYLISVSDSYCEATSFNGHGVGISGCGATGMAEAGKDYKEILRYYLKGVDIETYDFSS
jgi:hypothetical protein